MDSRIWCPLEAISKPRPLTALTTIHSCSSARSVGPKVSTVFFRTVTPVQTGPGAHPSSYTMGTGLFPGVKRPGCGLDPPPPI